MFVPSILGFIVGVIIGLGRHPEFINYINGNHITLSTVILEL